MVCIVVLSILWTASHVLYAMCGVSITLGCFDSRWACSAFRSCSVGGRVFLGGRRLLL